MGKFIITEEEKKHIMGLYEQVSGTTTTTTMSPSTTTTLNTPQAWGAEIKKVQQEIGNPSTWTMDSYNRLQKTLNDYKTWRTTTPEGQAVKDSHNVEGEYVVKLPPHLQTTK